MKLFFFTLCILINSIVFAGPESCKISIFSNPEGVEIRIDSLWVGRTPIENHPLPAGRHYIEAVNPQPGVWSNSNYAGEFLVGNNADSVINIKFEKLVKINSTPFHASLMFNHQLLGKTPLQIPLEPNRGKTFTLEKEGFETAQFVLSDETSRIVKLQPMDFAAEEMEKSFGHKLFHRKLKSKALLLSASLITHWASFYFKNLADDNFERYSRNGDPAQMDKYWNDTKKYDRYSEISLGVSYAFLSGLIYTVLRQ